MECQQGFERCSPEKNKICDFLRHKDLKYLILLLHIWGVMIFYMCCLQIYTTEYNDNIYKSVLI